MNGLKRIYNLMEGTPIEIEYDGWVGVFVPLRRALAARVIPSPPAPGRSRLITVRAIAIAAAAAVLRCLPAGTEMLPKELLEEHDLLPTPGQTVFLPNEKNRSKRLYRFGHELWVEAERYDAQIVHGKHPRKYALRRFVPLVAASLVMLSSWFMKPVHMHDLVGKATHHHQIRA